jgi:cyanophycinase
MGFILLEGGAEFSGRMELADRRAIALAGGNDAPIAIIPAAAAPDDNHAQAGSRGIQWFQGLGALNVRALPLIDPASANDDAVSAAIRKSRLIFFLGGFPGYLADTLRDSASWTALVQAERSGAVIVGSSAGAMVLCAQYYDPSRGQIKAGLDLIPDACLVPHYDTFGRQWIPMIAQMAPACPIIGIDEQTGMINEGKDGTWQVYGAGAVTLWQKGRARRFAANQGLVLPPSKRRGAG